VTRKAVPLLRKCLSHTPVAVLLAVVTVAVAWPFAAGASLRADGSADPLSNGGTPLQIALQGTRSQVERFNVVQADLPTVGATSTQGVKTSDARGP